MDLLQSTGVNNMGLFRGSFWGVGGGGEITLCLKLGRIMLETLRITANTYVVSENMPVSFKALLILLISAFFAKNQCFLAKIVPLLKAIVWELWQRFF